MAHYVLTATLYVIRNSDGATIPEDPANRDYAAYQAWVAAGGMPDPYAIATALSVTIAA